MVASVPAPVNTDPPRDRDAERGEMRWFPKKKRLEMWLTRDMVPLFGEVAEARLNSLAASLGAEAVVKVQKRG